MDVTGKVLPDEGVSGANTDTRPQPLVNILTMLDFIKL